LTSKLVNVQLFLNQILFFWAEESFNVRSAKMEMIDALVLINIMQVNSNSRKLILKMLGACLNIHKRYMPGEKVG